MCLPRQRVRVQVVVAQGLAEYRPPGCVVARELHDASHARRGHVGRVEARDRQHTGDELHSLRRLADLHSKLGFGKKLMENHRKNCLQKQKN